MIKNFIPKLYVESIYHIDFVKLKRLGIDTLLFDIDNTVACYDTKTAETKVLDLFKKLKDMGFSICFVSNNNYNRVKTYAASLDVLYIYSAFKPLKRGFKKALALLGSTRERSAIIGDQIFTDIYGGNRTDLYTVLVNPISDKDTFFVKLKRKFERFIIKGLENSK